MWFLQIQNTLHANERRTFDIGWLPGLIKMTNGIFLAGIVDFRAYLFDDLGKLVMLLFYLYLFNY